MATSRKIEAFTLVGGMEHQETVFEDFEDQLSAKSTAPAIMFRASVRAHHPDMTVAVTTVNNVNLLAYAAAGLATAELDVSEDDIIRSRVFMAPSRHGDPGSLRDSTTYARYTYTWKGLKFIMYYVFIYPQFYQFICFPPDSDETVRSNSKATDALLFAAGRAIYGDWQDYIAVFDGYWRADVGLYQEVQKTSWSDVILDQEMKNTISHTIEEFFDNESRYRDLDIPWKRGIILHGPPGNGKTLSLRALMHSLIVHAKQRPKPVTLLYVKTIPWTQSLRSIFTFARSRAPCLLIIEDIDTQVTRDKLSYFFNEVDGLENNDGVLMIATTNHLDQMDEGLKRPSRFDRRYLFPLPELDERTQYCEFWRKKLEKHGAKVEYPQALSKKIAGITDGFSFATMKEAFVATLLALARREDDSSSHGTDKGHDDIDELPLWREMQVQVELLRKEMGKADLLSQASTSHGSCSAIENKPVPAPRTALRCLSSQYGSAPGSRVLTDNRRLLDHGEPRYDSLEESPQTRPHANLYHPGIDAGNHFSDHLSNKSAAPDIPPSAAMKTTSSYIPASSPGFPVLLGPRPPALEGDYHILPSEFHRLLGQGDIRSRGPPWLLKP